MLSMYFTPVKAAFVSQIQRSIKLFYVLLFFPFAFRLMKITELFPYLLSKSAIDWPDSQRLTYEEV